MSARRGLLAQMLLGAALAAWPARGRAQSPGSAGDGLAIDPADPHALARVMMVGPTRTGPTLLVSGGYGYTESVLGTGDTHHRVAGSLTLDERVLPWLDVALRLDGRYDAHVVPGQPSDIGIVGEPRLFARADHAWSSGLGIGLRAGLWVPGRDALSPDPRAFSPELLGAASYAPKAAPIAVTANLGYRLDRSARSEPEAARLSPGDRLALEVSAFDEVLAGLAVTVGRGRTQGFVEASADLLVGQGAPSVKSSPMFLGGGARFALTPALCLEAEAEVSPSARPDVSPSAPLVPIPPRVAGWLGLAYRFGASPPARQVPAPQQPAAQPVPEPLLAPKAAEPPEPAAAADTTGAGDAPRDQAPAAPQLPGGQIRGLVRSLRGGALNAEIVVEPESPPPGAGAVAEPKRVRAESGRFKVDVAPGRYRVTIEAPGHTTQVRRVEVEENGVTLLNVDLRTER